MALDALGAALYYLFFLLGAVSIGGIALRLGNFPLPQDENTRLGYGAVAGITLTVFAALVDLVLNGNGFATAAGLFPILLTLSLVLATGMLAAVFKPTPATVTATQITVQREKTVEIERPTIQMGTATPERADEPAEEKVSITHGVQRMRKPDTTEKKKVVLPPPPKPPVEKKPELVQTKPLPTNQNQSVRLNAPPKPPTQQEVPPWVKPTEAPTRQPSKTITPPPIERIEPQTGHARRLYLHKDDNHPAQLIESRPPAELSSRQTEKEEIEEVARDARELSRFEQHKKQLEERKKTEAPKTTTKHDEKKKEPTEKSVSMNDLFGPGAAGEPAKPSGVFAQLDSDGSGGDLFAQLNAMDAGKPAAGKTDAQKPAGLGIEKGKCPNCNAATTRIVFCPHCGNAMCASCASSISPGPEGFEYVCPHCSEKVTVKKKKT